MYADTLVTLSAEVSRCQAAFVTAVTGYLHYRSPEAAEEVARTTREWQVAFERMMRATRDAL